MKKIINGKKYDTETAKEIGVYWNKLSRSDFRFCREVLYRKKTGEFFLHGEGGALSNYNRCCGNGQCGDEQIRPIKEQQARDWVEIQMGADEYEAIFGEVAE